MKTSLLKLAGVALLALALSSASKANPINGTIYFTGVATLDATVQTATSVTAISGNVGLRYGDFTSVANGAAVTWSVGPGTPWVFSPSGTQLALWSVGGFTFDVSNTTVVIQNPAAGVYWLNVSADGWVSGNGFDATKGVFGFSINGDNQNTTLTFTSSTQVPDGGTTALLVGLGLVSMSLVARRRK